MYYQADRPPSTGSAAPVTNEEASDARNSTVLASSSGFEILFMGWRAANAFLISPNSPKSII